ncbi:hypothetical protein PV328_003619 [Microctonus aethiopoides]|uniref:STI1 domain-containing protein n=1 Tax=Microctonus aethiopoides TaxID=144406 RepID=A0AA39F915_9HYME|nr:hypothetical protein PV328_003619 [Microctonus aethiopoides]
MSLPINKEQLAPLKVFTDLCMKNPQLLHLPDLTFVKEFIENFGGTVPKTKEDETPKTKIPTEPTTNEPENLDNSDPESDESDLELDMTGVVEPDNDPPQKMGNLSHQPTEDEINESQVKRSEAVSAFVEKDYDKAINLYTEAIILNPHAALLYAKRGQIYLALNKPNACIRDCNKALELNPDSAAGHKFRGRANQLLGNWEEAANDLRLACQFDFDEQANDWLREVTPNARKIEEHKRKKERKTLEKIEKQRQEAMKKARDEAKAREANSRPSQTDDGAGKPSMSDFYQYLNDPEVMQAFQDPEVAAAFVDISSNPANILKYQSNPKIMSLISKVSSKFGGAGGMAGGFPGMMGGMPGGFFPGGAGAAPPSDDVGLD